MSPCRSATNFGIALVLALVWGACSPQPYIKVSYQLPPPANALDGKSLSLAIAGDGKNEVSIGQNAKKSLEDFNGTFTLVVRRENGTGDLVGIYRLSSLLSEVFTHRLQQLGIHVTTAADNVLELKITLKRFNLDLTDRKWVVDMAYRADLIRDGRVLSGQTISGQAQRLNVMGKSDVEKLIGELLSDMVNRLDVVQLFQQAGA